MTYPHPGNVNMFTILWLIVDYFIIKSSLIIYVCNTKVTLTENYFLL